MNTALKIKALPHPRGAMVVQIPLTNLQSLYLERDGNLYIENENAPPTIVPLRDRPFWVHRSMDAVQSTFYQAGCPLILRFYGDAESLDVLHTVLQDYATNINDTWADSAFLVDAASQRNSAITYLDDYR